MALVITQLLLDNKLSDVIIHLSYCVVTINKIFDLNYRLNRTGALTAIVR